MSLKSSKFKNTKGRIESIMGPMCGGKSSELKRRIRRYESANKRCLLIKFDEDTRYDSSVEKESFEHFMITHDLEKIKAVPAHNLAGVDQSFSLLKPEEQFDCIGVDEIQFFEKNFMKTLKKWRKEGKIVICAGLHTDKDRKVWANSLKLIGKADAIDILPAVCKVCMEEDALCTWKFEDLSNPLLNQQKDIGGIDKYMPVCNSCYDDLKEKRKEEKKIILKPKKQIKKKK